MDRWLRFFTERFPLINTAVLVSGISLSGLYLSGSPPFSFLTFILSFIGIVFVLALMCLMEDVKNLEKDRIAHSNRPLPKGLIKKSEAIFVIKAMEIILFLYALILWAVLGLSAAISYFLIAAYFWLLNKDFGGKAWLGRRPIVYGFLYHLIIILIAIFAVEVRPVSLASPTVWSFALLLFGAFFCYDICSKLNPHAHPVLGTYIHFYGYHFVFNLAAICLAISAMGAISLGLAYILIPVELVVLAALSAVYFQPELFRLAQMLAAFSLVLHAWAVAIHASFV